MLRNHRSPNTKSAMPYYLPDITRRELLERIYDKMSDDEKKLFVQMTLQQCSTDEILQALQAQRQQIDRMAQKMERQSWLTDFGSDVAANFTTDGILWLLRRLFR